MADIATAVAVIRKAVDLLGSLVIEQGSLLYDLSEDINWIQTEMGHIHSYLADADAEAKQGDNANQGAKAWNTNFRNNISDLADDIEDIMDVYSPRMMNRCNRRRGFKCCLRTACCIFCDCCTDTCLGLKIKKIRKRVDDIRNAKTTYGTTSGSSTGDTGDARRSYAHIKQPHIVGFEKHIENLKAKLLNTNLQHTVISIVGMPGVGKTTLAREVYKHVISLKQENGQVKSVFECSAWIYVSQYPIVKNLLQNVARQVGLEKEKWEQDVEVNLYEFLRSKRYVIVVDDIWDQNVWEALIKGIPNNFENGSRIIITSRHDYVGRDIGGESSLYKLLPLDPEDSWKLFFDQVMRESQSTGVTSLSTELENLGRKILERCGDLPLAIMVTAGLLRCRQRIEFQWRRVFDSMGQREDECYKFLGLSYKDLPIELKPCFLYFGIFPKHREISAFQLINMWVAERFVEASRLQLLEDVAEDYLNQLIARNLVQAVRTRHDGRIKSCRIHDLLHNLCTLEAVKSNFFNTCDNCDNGSRNFSTRVRRVSIHGSSICEYISLENQFPKLRALLSFNQDEYVGRNQLKGLLGDLRFLRVLTIECRLLARLPKEIGSLNYLSYFEIKGVYGVNRVFVELPSTMGNLKNLLTLNVQPNLCIYFPTFIWKMKQLTHVCLPDNVRVRQVRRLCGLRSHNVRQVPRLRSHNIEVSSINLQTLCYVHSDCMEPEWLRKFTNLRKLGIVDPTEQHMEVLSGATPISEKLEKLQLIQNIIPRPLRYYYDMGLRSVRLNLSRYNNLRHLKVKGPEGKLPLLPPNLTKLTLKGCHLEEDPLVQLKNLHKLRILKLGYTSYSGEKMMCYGGANAFPKLQVLEISHLRNLQELFVEEGGMSKLNELRVRQCNNLTEMPDRLKDIMIRY